MVSVLMLLLVIGYLLLGPCKHAVAKVPLRKIALLRENGLLIELE